MNRFKSNSTTFKSFIAEKLDYLNFKYLKENSNVYIYIYSSKNK